MHLNTVAAASLLVAGASAGVGGMLPVGTSNMLMEVRMGDEVSPLMQKRQSNGVTITPGNSALNMTQWDADTSAACVSALSSLPAASNPSGTSICYNLPSLDTNTGIFIADLRVFQVSQPSGDFSGIPSDQIKASAVYRGATVTSLTQTGSSPRVGKREVNPTPLKSYMLVGQIDQAQLSQPMTMGVLEALLLPTITLSGVNAGGQTVNTNVSSNEAAFVIGIFSQEVIMSDIALAQLAVNNVTNGLQNGTVAFVLPGVSLMIFPVGLVITSVWMVAGVSVYAFGTFERVNYRQSYRARKARSSKPGYNARI